METDQLKRQQISAELQSLLKGKEINGRQIVLVVSEKDVEMSLAMIDKIAERCLPTIQRKLGLQAPGL